MTRIDTSPDSAQLQDEYVEKPRKILDLLRVLRELVAHLRDNLPLRESGRGASP